MPALHARASRARPVESERLEPVAAVSRRCQTSTTGGIPGALRVRPRAGRIRPRGGAPQPVRRDGQRQRESAPARAGQQPRLGDPGGPGGLRRRDVHCPGRPERRERPASRVIARKMRGTRPVGSAPPTRPPLAAGRNGAPSSAPLRASHAATGFTPSGAGQRTSPAQPVRQARGAQPGRCAAPRTGGGPRPRRRVSGCRSEWLPAERRRDPRWRDVPGGGSRSRPPLVSAASCAVLCRSIGTNS